MTFTYEEQAFLILLVFCIINMIIPCIMTLGLEMELTSVVFSSEFRYYALYYFINPLEVKLYHYLALELLYRAL